MPQENNNINLVQSITANEEPFTGLERFLMLWECEMLNRRLEEHQENSSVNGRSAQRARRKMEARHTSFHEGWREGQ